MTHILAIETSCDETATAVVVDGRRVLSNRVASQIEMHRRFGGVFPEVASRQHVLAIQTVIREALDEAGVARVADLDAIAVTHGPGLAGSLLVGVEDVDQRESVRGGLDALGVDGVELVHVANDLVKLARVGLLLLVAEREAGEAGHVVDIKVCFCHREEQAKDFAPNRQNHF